MTSAHCIIIGGSHAGGQLAAALRPAGWTGSITMVSDEAHPPYHRPPLSKAYLQGGKTVAELLVRPADFYAKQDVELRLNTRVTSLDRANKQVILADGSALTYTKLALATGARVRRANLPGESLQGVHYLRDLADVDRIRPYLQAGKRAVVIGGGYIGLEAAASLRALGMGVTVVEAMPRILQRVTAPEISAFFTRVHREEGVELLVDTKVAGFEGDTAVTGVTCADGTTLPADLVIVGIGVLPNVELAQEAGLEVQNGICVDAYARTSDPDIVAAGDCTFHHNPIYDSQLRLESVQNANDQARVAANTLCGKLEAYKALPWFWSDQFNVKLQIAGLSSGYDRVVARGDLSQGRSGALFYFKGERLLAVDAMNSPREFMMARKALGAGQTADPVKVADLEIPIGECFG